MTITTPDPQVGCQGLCQKETEGLHSYNNNNNNNYVFNQRRKPRAQALEAAAGRKHRQAEPSLVLGHRWKDAQL